MVCFSTCTYLHSHPDAICFGSFFSKAVSTNLDALEKAEAIATKVALFCLDENKNKASQQFPHICKNRILSLPCSTGIAQKSQTSNEEGVGSHKITPTRFADNLIINKPGESNLIEPLTIHFLSNSFKSVSQVLSKYRNYLRIMTEEGKMAEDDRAIYGDMVAKTAAITLICSKLIQSEVFDSSQAISDGIAICQRLCRDLMSSKHQSPEIACQITNICKVIGALKREMAQRDPRTLKEIICDQAMKMTSRENIEQIKQHHQFFRSLKAKSYAAVCKSDQSHQLLS